MTSGMVGRSTGSPDVHCRKSLTTCSGASSGALQTGSGGLLTGAGLLVWRSGRQSRLPEGCHALGKATCLAADGHTDLLSSA